MVKLITGLLLAVGVYVGNVWLKKCCCNPYPPHALPHTLADILTDILGSSLVLTGGVEGDARGFVGMCCPHRMLLPALFGSGCRGLGQRGGVVCGPVWCVVDSQDHGSIARLVGCLPLCC